MCSLAWSKEDLRENMITAFECDVKEEVDFFWVAFFWKAKRRAVSQ